MKYIRRTEVIDGIERVEEVDPAEVAERVFLQQQDEKAHSALVEIADRVQSARYLIAFMWPTQRERRRHQFDLLLALNAQAGFILR